MPCEGDINFRNSEICLYAHDGCFGTSSPPHARFLNDDLRASKVGGNPRKQKAKKKSMLWSKISHKTRMHGGVLSLALEGHLVHEMEGIKKGYFHAFQ